MRCFVACLLVVDERPIVLLRIWCSISPDFVPSSFASFRAGNLCLGTDSSHGRIGAGRGWTERGEAGWRGRRPY